ncbi:MAG: DoxX family protein [Gemmatimonadaceae bacterium]
MWLFRTATPRQVDLGLLIARLALGIVFLAHGGQKLFVFGLAGVTGSFTQMGIPMPTITAPLVALVEFGGGLALVLGLLTRLAALGIAIDMLGAIFLVHLKNGFFLPTGYEFALVLCLLAVTLMITGAGAYSLDARIGRRSYAPA